MMAIWMMHSVLVAALLLPAAWAAERALALYSRPTRFVWVGALLGTLLIPAVALILPSGLPSTAPGAGAHGPAAALPLVVEGLGARADRSGVDVGALLAGGWIVTSAVLLIRIVLARMKLDSALARATRRQVGAATLYLTSGLGPAVTGIRQGEVLMPRWLWQLGPRKRRLAVVHEREHLRAGDHWLLTGARLLVVLLPWNLPLWWGLHRLRLAVETDCDRRVVQGGADPRTYGDLLLRVGSRRSSRVLGFVALVERASTLERRIHQMTNTESTFRVPKALLAGGMALAAVLVACESPPPVDDRTGVIGDAAGSQSVLTADANPAEGCVGDCTLRVINRFEDRPVEIYVHENELGEYMGDVAAEQTEVFNLRNRKWPEVQLSIREAGSHRFISLQCVRQFGDGEARAVIEDPTSRERC